MRQVTILTRSDEDDLLLLASDGLWDVLSNQVPLFPHSHPARLPIVLHALPTAVRLHFGPRSR